MKILFISHHKWPHIGGVEKHIKSISERLVNKGYQINTISIEDINPLKIKYFGLLYIWLYFLKNISTFLKADIIHIHDVFIWILPIRIILFWKNFYITFHGWEGKYPIPFFNILNKKVASLLSSGSISVGNYINKWYGIKSDYVIYGGVNNLNTKKYHKEKNTVVWLGRQDCDTGFNEFKKWLKNNPKYKVTYITDKQNIDKYLKFSESCAPSGYLSYLEAKNYNCKIITFPNNPLKIDYWNEIQKINIIPTWDDVVGVYTKLWSK